MFSRLSREKVLFKVGLKGIVVLGLFLAFVPCITGASMIMVSPGQSINNAISSAQSGDIVFLKSGTYQLTEKIIMKSDIHLKGESAANTVIRAGPNTGGSVSGQTSDGWIYCSGLTNIEISNLAFTSSASGTNDGGRGDITPSSLGTLPVINYDYFFISRAAQAVLNYPMHGMFFL